MPAEPLFTSGTTADPQAGRLLWLGDINLMPAYPHTVDEVR